jgi:hypothetical protein
MNHVAIPQAAADYAAPLAILLTLGEMSSPEPEDWPDYAALASVGPEHIQDLIRMACDEALVRADWQSLEAYGPMHAWRALGQLRAEAAIAPLLTTHPEITSDREAAMEELPFVFGLIGPAAIAPIASFLTNSGLEPLVAGTGLAALTKIATNWPDTRDECVAILTRVLADPDLDPLKAGLAICELLNLRAVEAIDTIRGAYERDGVDTSIPGDLDDVEIELGLREQPATPAPPGLLGRMANAPIPAMGFERPAFVRPAAEAPGPDFDSTIPKPRFAGDSVTIRPVQPRSTVGRNDPCPCGSGKKYKKCCLS